MISGKSLRPVVLSCDIICPSEPRMPDYRGSRVLALLMGAVAGDFAARASFSTTAMRSPASGRTVEAEHFDRDRRSGGVDGFALVVIKARTRPHLGAGDD